MHWLLVDVIAEMPVVKAGTQNGDKIKKLTIIRTQLGPVVNPRGSLRLSNTSNHLVEILYDLESLILSEDVEKN